MPWGRLLDPPLHSLGVLYRQLGPFSVQSSDRSVSKILPGIPELRSATLNACQLTVAPTSLPLHGPTRDHDSKPVPVNTSLAE